MIGDDLLNSTFDIMFDTSECSGFSRSNAKSRGFDDPRSDAMVSAAEIRHHLKDKNQHMQTLVENVLPRTTTMLDTIVTVWRDLKFYANNAYKWGCSSSRDRVWG